MNQSPQLFQLQQIDSKIEYIKNRLNKIAHILESDEKVNQAENYAKNSKLSLRLAQKSLCEIEEIVKEVRTKIEISESKLYSGKISNPKELQDLQKEVISNKRRLSSLEDKQLDAMLILEQTEQENQKSQERLANVSITFENQKTILNNEINQLDDTLERLQKERFATIGSISQENQTIYNTLREKKRGLAVSKIEDGACAACGVILRPAELQRAQSPDKIMRCSSCGRLLYSG